MRTFTINGLIAHKGNVPMLFGKRFSSRAIFPCRIGVRHGKWDFIIRGDCAPFEAFVVYGNYSPDRRCVAKVGFKTAHAAARWLEAWVSRNHSVFGRMRWLDECTN